MIFSRIALYGNIYYDYIDVNGDYQYTAIGGIGNLYNYFNKYTTIREQDIYIESLIGNDKHSEDIKSFFQCSPNLHQIDNVSNIVAHIDVNTHLNHKFVSVNNKLSKHFNAIDLNIKTYWSHFCYLDDLPSLPLETLEQVRRNSRYVSVDFCTGNHDLKYLDYISKYIDIIFISKEHFIGAKLANRLRGSNPNLTIIAHHPCGSDIYAKLYDFSFSFEKIEDVNPLAAGDIFAASYIEHYINNSRNSDTPDTTVKEAVIYAHDRTQIALLNKWNEQR